MSRIIDVLQESALADRMAAVADAGSMKSVGADFFDKVQTVVDTFRTGLAAGDGGSIAIGYRHFSIPQYYHFFDYGD